ncbi:MAG: leucine-rich repeat protein [Bacteroidales bacterium]|nr:leucine-rich repeat protein [Candidatus Physcocola equi]
MKKLYAFIVLCFVAVAVGAQSSKVQLNSIGMVTQSNITYQLYSDNTAEVFTATNASGDVVIPSAIQYNGNSYTVNWIAMEAFQSNTVITSVVIPNTVTTIEKNAFESCINMTKAEMPNSVTNLGDGVFYNCSSLVDITFTDKLTEIPKMTFQGCGSLVSFTVPENVTSIGDGAFSMCQSLSKVILPSSLTKIGAAAFSWDSDLEEINFPEKLESLGDNCFKYAGVVEASFQEGLKSIGAYAFCQNTRLRSIHFPKSLQTIGLEAFSGNWRVSEVRCESATPIAISANVFSGCNGTLYVPRGSAAAYKAAQGWDHFATVVEPLLMGDANQDGKVDVSDVTVVVNYILNVGGFSSADAMDAANVCKDSNIDVSDVTGIINIILSK